MIIGICGYNSTGSSAVLDLLKEYEENYIIEQELSFLFLPDGISCLDYAISGPDMYFCGDVGIRRYFTFADHYLSVFNKKCSRTTQDYISSLIQAKWVGSSCFDATRDECFRGNFWNSERKKRQMYLAHKVDNFVPITQRYVTNILKDIGYTKEDNCIINQFFSASDPAHTMRYVNNSRAIVVNRDPRDVFIIGRILNLHSCYPHDNVEDYVKYVNCYIKKSIKDKSGNTLYLQFEDLIYRYADTVKAIEDFCHIKEHTLSLRFFNPEKAKRNVQLKHRFPELKKEIAYIEASLPEMLYDFPAPPILDGTFF